MKDPVASTAPEIDKWLLSYPACRDVAVAGVYSKCVSIGLRR